MQRQYREWSEQHGRATAKPIDATFESVLLHHNYDVFATAAVGRSTALGGETLSTTGFHRQGE